MNFTKKVLLAMAALLIIGSTAQGATWRDNGNGTVTDTDTDLTWEKMPAAGMTAADAAAYCGGLGLAAKDWRLPTMDEMLVFVDAGQPAPYFITGFDGNLWPAMWSSEPVDANRTWSFSTYFEIFEGNGDMSFDNGHSQTARCVCDQQVVDYYELTIPKTGFYTLDISDGAGGQNIEVFVNDVKIAEGTEATEQNPMVAGNFNVGDEIYVTYNGVAADDSWHEGDDTSSDSMYWDFDSASTTIHIIDPPSCYSGQEMNAEYNAGINSVNTSAYYSNGYNNGKRSGYSDGFNKGKRFGVNNTKETWKYTEDDKTAAYNEGRDSVVCQSTTADVNTAYEEGASSILQDFTQEDIDAAFANGVASVELPAVATQSITIDKIKKAMIKNAGNAKNRKGIIQVHLDTPALTVLGKVKKVNLRLTLEDGRILEVIADVPEVVVEKKLATPKPTTGSPVIQTKPTPFTGLGNPKPEPTNTPKLGTPAWFRQLLNSSGYVSW